MKKESNEVSISRKDKEILEDKAILFDSIMAFCIEMEGPENIFSDDLHTRLFATQVVSMLIFYQKNCMN